MGEAINSDALRNFPPIFFVARLLTQKKCFLFFCSDESKSRNAFSADGVRGSNLWRLCLSIWKK